MAAALQQTRPRLLPKRDFGQRFDRLRGLLRVRDLDMLETALADYKRARADLDVILGLLERRFGL